MPSCNKVPSPYLQRILMPALHDDRIIKDLSPAELEASWLHPIVLQCTRAPLLWKLTEWPHLTVKAVACMLLVAMLKLTRNSVQTVSKELVIQLEMWREEPASCSMTVAQVQQLQAAETLVGAANQPSVASSSSRAVCVLGHRNK